MEELQEIQADAMADDIEIDLAKMSLWTKDQAVAFFESGGEDEPKEAMPLPPMAPKMPPVDDATFKKWFPKAFQGADRAFQQPPKFRMVCFIAAGCSESMWSGNGLRQKEPNPFVAHCKEKGGEMLAIELPGREQRRNDPRSRSYGPYVEQLFPVLMPLLQDGIPFVFCAHSFGTWLMYELLKKMVTVGIPLPKMCAISGFGAPDLPLNERPWPQNKGEDDDKFKENCKGWDVNEIALIPANFKTFGPMFRDDFSCFDEYVFTPLPDCVAGGFPIPFQVYYATKDKRVKEHHVVEWKKFTSEKCDVYAAEGNHLFFFDVPQRATFMTTVLGRLPAEFK